MGMALGKLGNRFEILLQCFVVKVFKVLIYAYLFFQVPQGNSR